MVVRLRIQWRLLPIPHPGRQPELGADRGRPRSRLPRRAARLGHRGQGGGGFLHFLAEGATISVTGFYAWRFGLHNEWWVDEEDRARLGMSVGLSVFF